MRFNTFNDSEPPEKATSKFASRVEIRIGAVKGVKMYRTILSWYAQGSRYIAAVAAQLLLDDG